MNRIPRTPLERGLGKLSLGLFAAFCIASLAWADTDSEPGFGAFPSDVSVRGRLLPDGSAFTRTAAPSTAPSKLERVNAAALAASDAVLPLAVEDPPAICSGYGSLNSISLTDWEAGLGSWTVGTRSVANPATFSTEDWAVVASLPDSRAGKAAFVANLDTGDCSTDDETGVLFLTSPPILLPQNALVPRVSIHHWFAIERGWDGGNLKLKVNNGGYQLIPASAIEFNTYVSKLFSADEDNSNPLAGGPAYTGTREGLDGAWEEVRVNLNGLAGPGDTIRIRFDFGIDGCDGVIGWYVDDVRVYSCSDELPPSDCGNGVLDPGEQCDDGNNFIDDGCSNTCQVDPGWECTDPLPPGEIGDPGFEKGTCAPEDNPPPLCDAVCNPDWTETSTNFCTPICDEVTCGLGTGTGPASGDYWAWFGGIEDPEEASLQQSITIPPGASTLTFELEASTCDSESDYLELLIGGKRKFLIDGSSPLCESQGYTTQTIDISEFAGVGARILRFHAGTFAVNQDVTNFFVDDISIQGAPSECTQLETTLILKKVVVNNNGGSATPADWTLNAIGPTPFSGSGPSVSSGPGFAAGTYQLTETGGSPGYDASAWACVGGNQLSVDSIALTPGQSATCTITNDDIDPSTIVLKDGFEAQ
jgi:cysteine-rich repeat protein